MKPLVLCAALMCCLGLAACAPLSIYHRAGVTVAQMQSDRTTCEIRALKDVPPSNQLRRDPDYYVPGRRICHADRDCYTRPGYFMPGAVYTVDVNAGLRGRAEAQCMSQKGYVPVTLPNCPPGVARAVPPAATVKLPQLTPASCVIRNSGGSWQIVSPAP